MSPAKIQQLVVFAAIFLICQVGFSWLQDQPVTPGSFGWMILTTLVATVFYAVLTAWLGNRKDRGE
jgi:hypothetical protein